MAAFSRIAVAVDGSPNAEKALDDAIELAVAFHSELTIVSVIPIHVTYTPAAVPPPSIFEEEERSYTQLLITDAKRAEDAGVAKVTTVRLRGLIPAELLAYFDANPPDLIVMGARGLSAGGRLFLGSTSDAVVHHVQRPVLIVKG